MKLFYNNTRVPNSQSCCWKGEIFYRKSEGQEWHEETGYKSAKEEIWRHCEMKRHSACQ